MGQNKHSGIAMVIGTKAELIKCMPIMKELERIRKGYWFIHTGQHSLGRACEEFGVKKPDFILSKEPEISTKFWSKINKLSIFWFSLMILKIRKLIKKINPKYVLYHGDTMSTSAASIGSSSLLTFSKKWKNVHLEAGLRSGSLLEPFPEEISRRISSYFSDILLAVSDVSHNNLERERVSRNKEKIKIGNTIVDSANIIYEKAKKKHKKRKEKYALINIHRHENLNNKKRMEKIIEILKNIEIRAIWPLHDNTKYYLKKYGLFDDIKKQKNIEIVPLANYFKFIFMLGNCEFIVTDGGSIQEESLVFKKPCILLRNLTERPEGLSTGINFLTKLNVEATKDLIKFIESGKIRTKKFRNPYGEKGVSKKILEILR